MSRKPTYEELENRVRELERVEKKLLNTEKRLRESEELLNAFLDNSPAGFGIWDRNFRYVYLNEVLRKINGPSMEAHLGKTIEEVLPKAAHIVVPLFEEIISTGQAFLNLELQGEVPSRPGEISCYLVSYFPVSMVRGKPRFIGGFVVDITERKQAEWALGESEEKFRQLVENINDVYWVRDTGSGRLLYISPNFEKIWSVSNLGVKDKSRLLTDSIHPEDKKEFLRFYGRLNENESFELEYRVTRTDNTIRWVLGKNFPILDDTGSVYRRAFVNQDITDRKNMEKALLQGRKMESIGSLAGGIAHDFNNILSPIVGMSELLLEDLPEGSPEHENAREILTAGKRGGALVGQILAFSRQNEHKMMPVHIQGVLREVLKLARSTIPSNIEIIRNVQAGCGMVMADPTQLHRIAMNLITNAYHAVEESGGSIFVDLGEVEKAHDGSEAGSALPGKYALLAVKDTGGGIAPDILDNIFDPYFTTKEQGRGTGLGLSVVYGIVREHGGFIEALGEPGKGATFNVYLPLMEKTGDTASLEQPEAAPPTGNERILLVDDEEPVARLHRRILERLGYRVTSRLNGMEALETFKANPDAFDLVITDMTMPLLTGDRLAREIMGIKPDMPVVMCSGFNERSNPEKAVELGIKGFLAKPVLKSDLANMVRKVLDENLS